MNTGISHHQRRGPRRERAIAVAARAALRWSPGVIPAGGARSLQVAEGAGELEALRREWGSLQADFGGPSNHLEWWIAHAHAPESDARLCVVVLRDAGRLVGIAPLLRARGAAGKLRLINSDDASGLLYADEQTLAWLIDAVLALRRTLALPSLIVGSPTARVLEQRIRRRGYLRWNRSLLMGPSVALDDRFDQPLAPLSSKRRKSLRRRQRKAEELGSVSFDVEEVHEDPTPQFEELLRIEGSGWKGREGTAIAQDVPQRERLRRFVSSPLMREHVRFGWMRIDGSAIAGELAVMMDDRMWAIKAGYDERFPQLSPGILLELHLMSWAAQQGLETYELMGHMDGWKRPFGEGILLLHVRVYPISPRGILALALEATEQGGRILGTQVRSWLATRREAR